MIQYYNTEAEYAAALKDAFESQVSRIGENNAIKYDGRNVVVGLRSATTGAIVAIDSVGALHFIPLNSEPTSTFLQDFTVVGVVAVGVEHEDFRGKVVIVNKANASKKWSEIYSFKLTGYTLDGTDRTGTLNVRDSSAWGTGVDYVISYNAETASALVEQLNTYFQANAPFTAQHWRADADSDGNITLSFLFADYRQASNSVKNGFALTANLLPEIVTNSNMLRVSGQRASEGAIANWERALVYYRNDNGTSGYQGGRTTVQTSIKQTYPINLPTWLGTSTKNPGDFCAALRAVYGEGEAGWLKFMKTCLTVQPSAFGAFDKSVCGDGERNTYIMAGRMFEKQDGTSIVAFPAADYCAAVSYNHPLLKKGAWQLPDVDTLTAIHKNIRYNAVNNKKADPINKALDLIGGSAVSNGSGIWSSSRFNAGYAWCSNGDYGGWNGYAMYRASLALPVALLDVSEANS